MAALSAADVFEQKWGNFVRWLDAECGVKVPAVAREADDMYCVIEGVMDGVTGERLQSLKELSVTREQAAEWLDENPLLKTALGDTLTTATDEQFHKTLRYLNLFAHLTGHLTLDED